MFEIRLDKEMINKGYIKHQGKFIKAKQAQISTDSDYIIILCSDLALVNDYINDANKRYYILLDKKLSNFSSSSTNSNVWYVNTNMSVPNIIVANDFMYSINFDSYINEKNIIKSTMQYLKNRLMFYVQKNHDIQVNEDIVFFFNQDIEELTGTELNNEYGVIISDEVKLKSTYRTHKSQNISNLIEFDNHDYATIISKGLLHFVINEESRYIILKSDIKFKIEDYEHLTVFSNFEFIDLYDLDILDQNYKAIVFKDVEKVIIDLKVNLKERSDKKLLLQKQEEELKKINKKSIIAKKIEIEFNLIDKRITDLKNHNKFIDFDYSKDEKFEVLENDETILKNNNEYILVTDKLRSEYNEIKVKEILKR